jgi:DNA mismatch repair protein MutL
MESKIIKLDKLTINKIAAGEVIERPASVVKELVENSIDAGSSEIAINIQEGGRKLIEVIDDGLGMTHDDVLLAIQRYSTSKIKEADDLFSINTLGFRGEALASIVSVAMVEITTKVKNQDLGTHLVIEGGEIKSDNKISTTSGTRIMIKNLFFNVPVRRKFLKSISTEMNHITEFITKYSLAYPDISFSLTHNGKTVISSPKGNLIAQITEIFGKNIAKGCLAINTQENGYTLEGFITKPELSRKSKDYMYTFVKGRPVSNKTLNDSIIQGYGTSIPHGRYPIVFTFLDLPLDELDVNVHPTKKEVRFSQENKIFSLVETAVSDALQASGLSIFERVAKTRAQPTLFQELKPQEKRKISERTAIQPSFESKMDTSTKPASRVIRNKTQVIEDFLPIEKVSELKIPSPKEKRRDIRVIGILKDTYIIAETQEGLFLCDQHAAHEKINYVKYLDQLHNKNVKIQQLLSPVNIDLKPSEFEIIKEIISELNKFGFEVEIFGKNELIIRTIPSIMKTTISHDIAKDIIDIFKEHVSEIKKEMEFEDLSFIKDIISVFACKRSIKAGDRITVNQAEKLISKLLALDEPFTCPHGRPTIIILNENYIEELFQRDYR